MTSQSDMLNTRIEALQTKPFMTALTQIKRGVEREALRIKPNGEISQKPHPTAFGSALTHESITTDYSESLLEFITPPEASSQKTLAQLQDVHKFVLENMGDEQLWPLSMPCFIENEADIPIAYYGESNIGKMKRVYRTGLKNRYGSMMQAISGVHFNFSLPESFWSLWAELHGKTPGQDQTSEDYFSLIRNYRRYCWLIPFLYGASPALCGSFLEGKPHALPFEKVGKGTYYMPYATSLRMSDLGYTSDEQSSLKICYNQIDNYVRLLRTAMNTPSERFSAFSAGEGGHYQQLSKHIIQIENELYSPIRPKQPANSMEKPSDALVRRGVSYIEVRALDVDPYTPLGISQAQCDFLDVFLLSCLVIPSPELDSSQLQEAKDNMNTVVLEGRKPGLMLQKNGTEIGMAEWAEQLFASFADVARLLDKAHDTNRYAEAVQSEWKKIENPSTTPSGKMLSALLADNIDNGNLGLALASSYKQSIAESNYTYTNADAFKAQAVASLAAQKKVESEDEVDFDTFIRNYFDEAPAKKNA